MFLNVMLITDSSNQPYFLAWEGFSALLEHVRMSDVKAIKDAVCVDSQHFLLSCAGHYNQYYFVRRHIYAIIKFISKM